MVTLMRVSREANLRFDRSRIKAIVGIAVIVGCLVTIFYVFSRPSRNEIGPEHDFVNDHCGRALRDRSMRSL